jgi:hypothetical protein
MNQHNQMNQGNPMNQINHMNQMKEKSKSFDDNTNNHILNPIETLLNHGGFSTGGFSTGGGYGPYPYQQYQQQPQSPPLLPPFSPNGQFTFNDFLINQFPNYDNRNNFNNGW